MDSGQTHLTRASPPSGFVALPASACVAIVGLVIFTSVGIFAGAGNTIRFTFPVASLAAGLFLYCKYPLIYTSFTWWMWFLTPLVARLVDYRSGSWDAHRLMLLGPYLVTSITIIPFLKYLPRASQQNEFPFVLAAMGIAYGFLISIVLTSPYTAIRALLDWLTPVIFGFYLLINWRHYPHYAQSVQRTFFRGTLLMGLYGCFQFLVAPAWDQFWLVNTKIFTFGTAVPLGMRVWSTMNDPGTFAIFMIPGLIFLLDCATPLRFPGSAVGYLSFFLTKVRTAWLGWFVALLFLFSNLRSRQSIRIITNILVIGAIVLPLSTIEPFSNVISDRLKTFSNLEADPSYNARHNIYEEYLNSIIYEVVGRGIGNGVVDSGSLDILISLGLLGSLLFVGGILLLLSRLFQQSSSRTDSFINASRSICISVLAMLLSSNTLIAPTGLLFWGLYGLSLAGYRYYAHREYSDKIQGYSKKNEST